VSLYVARKSAFPTEYDFYVWDGDIVALGLWLREQIEEPVELFWQTETLVCELHLPHQGGVSVFLAEDGQAAQARNALYDEKWDTCNIGDALFHSRSGNPGLIHIEAETLDRLYILAPDEES
jgi:hypothetical protein